MADIDSSPVVRARFRAPSGTDKSMVISTLSELQQIPEELIAKEVDWFYEDLGVHEHYFESMGFEDTARHITSLYAAKVLRQTSARPFDIVLEREHADRAMFVVPSSVDHGDKRDWIETRIEADYMSMGYRLPSKPEYAGRRFRLQAYRTLHPVENGSTTHLRFYFLQQPVFADPEAPLNCVDIKRIADKTFLAEATENTLTLYSDAIKRAMDTMTVAVSLHHIPDEPWEKRVVLAFRHDATHSFFSGVVNLWGRLHMRSVHKYVEQFSNGMTVHSVYIRPKEESRALGHNATVEEFEANVRRIVDLVPFLFILPRTGLSGDRSFGFAEHAYAYAGWMFAYVFLKRYSDDYHAIAQLIGKDPKHSGTLTRLKRQLRMRMFTVEQIRQTVMQHKDIIALLYHQFEQRHQPKGASFVERHGSAGSNASIENDPRAIDLEVDALEAEARQRISVTAANDFDVIVLEAFLKFNRSVMKTNFFKKSRSALCFRLDPSFLSEKEYVQRPYGIFFLVGSEFIGFHIRFADVARGGIRVIKSATPEVYATNFATLFDENYNLASTQQAKNKDIPEGGSKGTILLSCYSLDKPFVAFKKYVDALLDCLLLPHPEIVDHYKKEEILFLGPDEGTADYMAWAALHAKSRGASFWKAFTTGKPVELGGIPHDTYGMTTRSVHQYVLGILGKIKEKEEDWTKFQTGGPDGDLGSNEILISKDRTTSIVDGSGVLHDPDGINRDQLVKLAKARTMISGFEVSKLGPRGFRVLVTEKNVTLPDGSVVASGLLFRNGFHLSEYSSAKLFVPCGGRPAAVNASNVDELLNFEGNPRFKYIVEGANLFFTQEARLTLEEKGVVLYKDASANKGGVTSSSLEVLAALSLTDEEFNEHMAIKDGKVPEFYASYVEDVQKIIERNARLEFECIWKEHERTGNPRSIVTDIVSRSINELNLKVQESVIWDSIDMRRKVISESCPPSLLKLVGVDAVLERVPDAYIRAIFGAYLAAMFTYTYGTEPSPLDFFAYTFNFAGLSFADAQQKA